MTAPTLRSCFSAGLLALALTALHGALAQSTSDDATMEAAGKCAATAGTAATACGTVSKGVLDFLSKTPEAQAWTVAASCGDTADAAHGKFTEIRRQARDWGKNPGSPPRIAAVNKVTGSDNTMCMFNAIVGSKNCMALLAADREAFHRGDPKEDTTKGWRAKFCK